MALNIVSKVTIVSKYVNQFKADDGRLLSYPNLTCIDENGRPDIVPVNQDIYDSVHIGETVTLGGKASGMGKSKNWWFNEVLKVEK